MASPEKETTVVAAEATAVVVTEVKTVENTRKRRNLIKNQINVSFLVKINTCFYYLFMRNTVVNYYFSEKIYF